jgi:UPF0176 protein
VGGKICAKTEEAVSIDPMRWLERNNRIREVGNPLPGSRPYDNERPMRVKLKYDGLRLLHFLAERHPHLPAQKWRCALDEGRLVYRGECATEGTIVQAGEIVVHIERDFTEPNVNAEMTMVYEDEWLFVINKSAPLPVHACGRFNRNCVVPLLKLAFPDLELKPTHRLDINTTGLLILAKSRESASGIALQFKNKAIRKSYLVQVNGHPKNENFSSGLAIEKEKAEAGSRGPSTDGLSAYTDFEVLKRNDDGTSYLLATPLTGRTNQLRIHLAALEHPIVGENAYGPQRDLTEGFSSSEKLHLHAWRTILKHPCDGKILELEADKPEWAIALED